MATPDEAAKTLGLLFDELVRRRTDVDVLEKAYGGEFRLHYASETFEKFFAKRYQSFSDNWCGVVADAPHERLQVTGIRLQGQDAGDKDLMQAWNENDGQTQSDLAFLEAIIAKRAYGLVWGDADDKPRLSFEHPAQAIVGYDPETRERVAGAKVWADDDHEYATLYLPTEVWKFQRDRISSEGQRPSGLYVPSMVTYGGAGWTRRQGLPESEPWPLTNPYGKVPLVELPNRPRLMAEPMSDISGTLSMQHAVNLLWAQLFVAADVAAFPAKVVMGAELPSLPILNEDGEEIGRQPIDLNKFAVDRVHWIDGDNVKIDEWSAASLDQWSKIIDKSVSHIAAQTRTPATYFLVGGTIANLNPEAVKGLETGLVKRTDEKTMHLGVGVRDIFELFALTPGGDQARAKAAAVRRGKVLWRDIENRSDAQLADALQKKRAMGYPLRYILELDGVDPVEAQRILDMVKEEAADPELQAAIKALSPQPQPTPSAPPPSEQ